jgi:ssDNA thymidine ADP-ribosyltransferase, DarT
MLYHYPNLNREKALIWRIVHRDNLPWILDNGLYCGNSTHRSESWVHIGNPELTTKRAAHPVPIKPGGYLNDYVPFYFTPFSVMMKNIHSGWAGVKRRANEEIVILVSSLPRLQEQGIPYIYTDSHAYYMWSNYYTDLADLNRIDWPILQARDFKRDLDDPTKFERYQAEALVFKHCPISALLGIICYTDTVKLQLDNWLAQRQLQLPVHTRTDWYFS